MRIAVYSGSFDPLHIGHKAIMEYLTQTSDFDWVYLVISPQNPFKDKDKALNAEQRYRAAVDAVRRHPELHVWVDDIELEMPAPHYTIRTLDALKKREPDNDFTLVVGADNLQGITGWRDAPRILSEYGVVAYPRRGLCPRLVKHLSRPGKHQPRRPRKHVSYRDNRRAHNRHILDRDPRKAGRRRGHVGIPDVALV